MPNGRALTVHPGPFVLVAVLAVVRPAWARPPSADVEPGPNRKAKARVTAIPPTAVLDRLIRCLPPESVKATLALSHALRGPHAGQPRVIDTIGAGDAFAGIGDHQVNA